MLLLFFIKARCTISSPPQTCTNLNMSQPSLSVTGIMTTFVNNALLLATLPNLFVPHFLTQVIAGATNQTRNRLVIVFFSRHFNTRSAQSLSFPDIQGLSQTESWDPVQRILTFTYVQATKVAWEANKIQMQVDVLLKGLNEDLDQDLGKDMDIVFRVSGGMFGCRVFLSSIFTQHLQIR